MATLQKLLEQARTQREQGKTELALQTFNTILLQAQKKGQHVVIVEAFTDRAIAFRHMFEETGDVLWGILARKDAEAMLDMVKMWGVSEKLHTAYYMLGQAALLFKDYASAENYFFKSLRYFKGSPSEKGSWRYHWAKALYMVGEKKRSLFAFSQALNEIKKNADGTDEFLVHVYLSGAYMSFAHVLQKDNPETAKKYYNLAKEIINSDKRLVVRKKQLQVLNKIFR
jgi:tetratricopeptide (TPR) repeat protein